MHSILSFIFAACSAVRGDHFSNVFDSDPGYSLLQFRASRTIPSVRYGFDFNEWLGSMSLEDYCDAKNETIAHNAASDARAESEDEFLNTHPTKLWIAHIVSLMPNPSAKDFAVLESMARAKELAEARFPGKLHVKLVGVQMVGETPVPIPEAFNIATPMSDNTASRWGCNKALPFAAEVVRALQTEAPHADLHIMTNADVSVMPDFYEFVAKRYRIDGYDALNILKVLVPATCYGHSVAANASLAHQLVRELPQIHPGSETFVWEAKRDIKFMRGLGDVFLGYTPVGAMMIQAAEWVSTNFSTLINEHLTYHVGAEGENGRGDPGIMGAYMKLVESDMPGCIFRDVQEVSRPHEEDKSCPYELLNIRAAEAATNGRRLMDSQQHPRRGMAPDSGFMEDVSAAEAEAWIPVRRADGQTND